MNLETKITIYKFTPQLFTLTRLNNHKSTLLHLLYRTSVSFHLIIYSPNMTLIFF